MTHARDGVLLLRKSLMLLPRRDLCRLRLGTPKPRDASTKFAPPSFSLPFHRLPLILILGIIPCFPFIDYLSMS
jgi:hypothetical protein